MLKIKIPADALSAEQMAGLLGCSRKTLHRYKEKGLIPKPIYINNRVVFWQKKVILEWLHSNDESLVCNFKNLNKKIELSIKQNFLTNSTNCFLNHNHHLLHGCPLCNPCLHVAYYLKPCLSIFF